MPTKSAHVAAFGTIELLVCFAGLEVTRAEVMIRPKTADTSTADVSLIQEYRFRTAGRGVADTTSILGVPEASKPDHDLRLFLDGEVRTYRDHLKGQISAAMWFDLDGYRPTGQPYVLGDPHDFRVQPVGVVYNVLAQWQQSPPLDYLRFGRQESAHGLPLTFDGGAIGVRVWERRLSLFAFGGRKVHFFEVQPGLLENWVTCLGARYLPRPSVYVEFDSRLEHEAVLAQDRQSTIWVYAHSYGLNFGTRSENSWSRFYVRGLNRKASQAGAAIRLAFPSIALGLDAQAAAQLRTLGEINETENPFFSLLGPSLPNLRTRLEIWKDIKLGEISILSIRAGWRVRQLIQGEEGPFNRNSGNIYFQTEFKDVAIPGLFVHGVGEWNYIPWSLTNDSFLAIGGSVGYTTHHLSLELGTSYQRWKIAYYRDVEELQNARTIDGSITFHACSWLEIRAHSRLEIVDRFIQSTFLSLREVL